MENSRIGEIHTNREDCKMVIIAYRGCMDCDVQFEDGTIIKSRQYSDVVRRKVKNPYYPSVCNKGFIGIGEYQKSDNGKITKVYAKWSDMLRRCYDQKYHKIRPTYIGCTVDSQWLNFQVFAKWFEENYRENFVLDKDILIKGNKIYSSKVCRFVPNEINSLFTKSDKTRGKYPIGVKPNKGGFQAYCNISGKQETLGTFKTPEKAFQAYKKAKEKEIKSIANFCKNIIPIDIYETMVNYKVEITD